MSAAEVVEEAALPAAPEDPRETAERRIDRTDHCLPEDKNYKLKVVKL